MLLVARKNLFSERMRLGISVGGVALSVFLISLLLSLYRGWNDRVGGFVENANVDLWIASEGTEDFLTAASLLPTEGPEAEQAQQYLDANAFVDEWSPMIVRLLKGVRVEKISATEEKLGTEMDIHLIGFDPETRLGGPIEIVEGKDTPGPDEIIVDTKLGSRYDVDVGDILRAGGNDWTVVGKSKGGDFVATQTVFVALEEARETLRMEGLTTFYVININGAPLPGGGETDVEERAVSLETDIEELATENQVPIIAHTREDFAASTRDRITSNILPILFVVLGLAFIVGVSVAGLTIYTATIEKAREYGILKAVGFRNAYVYRLVFEQSAVTALLGFIAGIVGTLVIFPLVLRVFEVPQFVLFTRWQDLLFVAVVTVLMAIIAGSIPVRRLAAIDPVSVFKG